MSVRIPEKELKEINEIARIEKRSKSEVMREVIDKGITGKRLEIALDKFQKNEVTASKASKIANIPLTLFLDILAQRNINFHYNLDELNEEFDDLK